MNEKYSADVLIYDPTSDSWKVISQLATPRSNCAAAVLQTSQLMVVGGNTERGHTDSTETADLEFE